VPVVSTFEHDDLLMQASLLSPRGTLGAYHCVVLLARSATNDRESRSDPGLRPCVMTSEARGGAGWQGATLLRGSAR